MKKVVQKMAKNLTITISDDMRKRLTARAEECSISISALVKSLIIKEFAIPTPDEDMLILEAYGRKRGNIDFDRLRSILKIPVKTTNIPATNVNFQLEEESKTPDQESLSSAQEAEPVIVPTPDPVETTGSRKRTRKVSDNMSLE